MMKLMKLFLFDIKFWEYVKTGIRFYKSIIFQLALLFSVAMINTIIRRVFENYTIPITSWQKLLIFIVSTYFCYILMLIASVILTYYIKKTQESVLLKKIIQITIYSSSFYLIGLVFNTLLNFYNIFGLLGQVLFILSFYRGIRFVFSLNKKDAIGFTISLYLLFIILLVVFSLFLINIIIIPFI